MIYFFQNIETGEIKIGVSGNPQNRLRNISRDLGVELCCLGTIDTSQWGDDWSNDYLVERMLHGRFTKYWLNKEWFYPGFDLVDFICGMCYVGVWVREALADTEYSTRLKAFFKQHEDYCIRNNWEWEGNQ